MQHVFDRLKEQATWIGLIELVTAADLVIEPKRQEPIIGAGTRLAGLIGVVTRG